MIAAMPRTASMPTMARPRRARSPPKLFSFPDPPLPNSRAQKALWCTGEDLGESICRINNKFDQLISGLKN